jgi:hypothetical protein
MLSGAMSGLIIHTDRAFPTTDWSDIMDLPEADTHLNIIHDKQQTLNGGSKGKMNKDVVLGSAMSPRLDPPRDHDL